MNKIKIGSPTFTLIFSLFILGFINSSAAPLHFEPVSKKLPDGSMINLFISGDEFFNYLHDANEFPVGEGSDGNYYYLIQTGDNFNMTTYRYPVSDPVKIKGIKKVSIPSFVAEKRKAFYKKIDEELVKKGIKTPNKSVGAFNNLVIYIRFLGEGEFSVQRSVYETRLNSLTSSSLRYYYKEISYNKLDIVSYNYPGGSTSNIYYTDINARSYYQPYSATINTNGYRNDTERATREHTLLASAINWATTNYSLPAGVNFDVNQDGIVDNICFIIKGTVDGWNDLLWPHRWVLYTQTVKLGNLNVYGYTIQMENVTVNTFSHEMFHALGAPDLYHYDNTDVSVGPWDIMASGACHPGAWMKYKYGGWINKTTEIVESGTYVIKPLTQENKNCYLLRSPYREDQFFMLEFRKKSGTYESNLPASGLIIQRIDTRYRGNSTGSPDEIYVYRPNGSLTAGGVINNASFSDLFNRKSFSDISNPYSFFQDGSLAGINITNIISMGDSMSFTVSVEEQPIDLILKPGEDTQMNGSWKSVSNKEYLVAVSSSPETFTPTPGHLYSPGDTIGLTGTILQRSNAKTFSQNGLISDEQYYYTVWTLLKSNPVQYSASVSANMRTGIYSTAKFPYFQSFDYIISELPRGWKSTSGSAGWQVNLQSPFSAPGSILMQNPSQNPDEWFYTPGFDLLSINTYMISFNYMNKTSGVKESLSLQGGTDRSKSSLSIYTLFSSGNFDYKDYSLFKGVFKPSSSRTYYFGFKNGSIKQGVIIDDFKIEKVPGKTSQHVKPEEFYPNPTSGKITIPATGVTEITVFSTSGTRLYETSIESMRVIDLSFLGKGVYLIRFTTNEKKVTSKIIIL